MRELAAYDFSRVKKLVENERVLRNIRRTRKQLVDTIGESYLKKTELNRRAFICINCDGEADEYIEGLSELTSPPLSMPSSAKPSVCKQTSASAINSEVNGKRSCTMASSSQLIECQPSIKPATAHKQSAKKSVTFINTVEEEKVHPADPRRTYRDYMSSPSEWKQLTFKQRCIISSHGSIE